MKFTIYKVINKINGKYYIGKHKTNTIYDNYMGSGIGIRRAIKKYGIENFTKEILFVFDNEQDMNNKEKELVNEEVVKSSITYNSKLGGIGGWDYVNTNFINHGSNNIMNTSNEAKQKVIEKLKIIRKEEKYIEISKQNIQKAIEYNTGRKRPEHSKFISEWNKERWKQNKKLIRDQLSNTYKIVDPNGKQYITNRLKEFCKTHNLPYTVIYSSVNYNGRKPIKGKAKDWSCQKI